MRKIPASEQPTQLVVREITESVIVERVRQRLPIPIVAVVAIIIAVCAVLGFAGVFAADSVANNIETDEGDVVFEVVERAEPVTVASTTGEAASKVPLSSVFTDEVQFWQPLIAEWAVAWEIDPNLIATVIQIESCGDPTVSSSAGAQGLFQVMPFHFDPGEDMLDISNNAQRGMAYLSTGLDISDGHPGLAMAGYNGGHSVINRGTAVWAYETQRYYYWGTGIYEDARSGAETSDRLQEWLNAGGASLCQRAAASQQSISLDVR